MYEVIEWHNANFINDKSVKFRLKDIFADNWDNFLKNNPDLDIRPIVFKEVDKLISCRTSSLGYSVFECSHCGEIKFSYNTCKSRFCPCKHRHIVFTISDYLWPIFRNNRKLLDLLFKAVSKTLLSWFKEKYKSEKYTSGIILVLHTYGRDMKWNTHIHAIVTEFVQNVNMTNAFH